MTIDPIVDPEADPETAGSGQLPSGHLGWAIAVAALGFLPFGVIAIVQALRTTAALRAGDLVSARKRSRAAKRWIIGTVVVAVLVDLVILGALLLLGAFAR
ncbi:MAG: CD225/dispanin family protein [Actinomycetota bacterium]|nr:CD225/dispanin family protein [Actinomycetota bacterium]